MMDSYVTDFLTETAGTSGAVQAGLRAFERAQ
jgi:hypothetical protein